MRCAAPDFILASFAGTRMVPAIKAGISSVKRMNVLDRMRSRYSRWTMSQTLCIFSYNVDENLFQRRFQKLKPGDARLGGCRAQQLLGVGPGFQADFHIVAVIVEGLHQVAALQLRVAFVLHLHMVLAVAGLDLLQIAFQDGPAMVNQADGIAQPLDLVMRCVENRIVFPAFFNSSKTSFSMTALAGSRPAKGSSMMTSSGSCSSAAMNCTFCCIPLDSSSTFLSVHSLS